MSLPLDDADQIDRHRQDTINIDLWYPGIEDHAKYLEIGLIHVRASDGIRVWYDFKRDGFVVEQPWYERVEITKPGATYRSFDEVEHWQEVGFFRSWALKSQNVVAPPDLTRIASLGPAEQRGTDRTGQSGDCLL